MSRVGTRLRHSSSGCSCACSCHVRLAATHRALCHAWGLEEAVGERTPACASATAAIPLPPSGCVSFWLCECALAVAQIAEETGRATAVVEIDAFDRGMRQKWYTNGEPSRRRVACVRVQPIPKCAGVVRVPHLDITAIGEHRSVRNGGTSVEGKIRDETVQTAGAVRTINLDDAVLCARHSSISGCRNAVAEANHWPQIHQTTSGSQLRAYREPVSHVHEQVHHSTFIAQR